jgi:hypothetical protein
MDHLGSLLSLNKDWDFEWIEDGLCILTCPHNAFNVDNQEFFPGPIVCQWGNQPYTNVGITKSQALSLYHPLPIAKELRKRCGTWGFDWYEGPHQTSQPSVSPGSGPGTQTLCQHFRRVNKLTPGWLQLFLEVKNLQHHQYGIMKNPTILLFC